MLGAAVLRGAPLEHPRPNGFSHAPAVAILYELVGFPLNNKYCFTVLTVGVPPARGIAERLIH